MLSGHARAVGAAAAIVLGGIFVGWLAALGSVVGHTESPALATEAARVLAESDRAMAAEPFVREERLDTSGAPDPNAARVEVWQYEGDRYRIAAGGGTACTWFPAGLETHGSPAFSQRARGGDFAGVQPGGTPADQLELQHSQSDGREAFVITFHYKVPTVEGPDDVWETDWIDPQSYRLLRYVQTISGHFGSSTTISSALLYPPTGPLRGCPTTATMSTAALKPLLTPGE